MARSVFSPPSVSKLPENDPRVIRVDMEVNEMGARKSHLPRDGFKNDQPIVHVGTQAGLRKNS